LPSKNKEKSFDLHFNQNFSPIFHWLQAAPTRYRQRSHCVTLCERARCWSNSCVSLV